MPTSAARTRTKPTVPSQRRKRRAPVAATRGWQHHKSRVSTVAKARQTGRRFNRNRKNINRAGRRYAKRRGAVWGVVGLGIAATAFTLAFTGAVSEVAAWELGLASDGLWFGAAWVTGDLRKPADQSRIKRTAAAAKSRAAVCGAPTVDGTACKNRGRCPHHKGGAKGRSTGNAAPQRPSTARTTSASPQPTGPRVNKGVPGTTRTTNP